jgi:hypothetical protein
MRRYAQGLERGDQLTFLRCCRDLVQLSEQDGIGQRYQALAVPRLYCHGDSLSNSSVAMLKPGHGGGSAVPGDQPLGPDRCERSIHQLSGRLAG